MTLIRCRVDIDALLDDGAKLVLEGDSIYPDRPTSIKNTALAYLDDRVAHFSSVSRPVNVI